MKQCSIEGCVNPLNSYTFCKKHYDKDRYEKNRDKFIARSKRYAAEHREEARARTKAWDEARPYNKAIRTHLSYLRNVDKRKKYEKQWRLQNRLRVNFNASKRRARIRKNGIYKILNKEFRTLANSPCFYCGSWENPTLDHVIPIARGGTHSIGNLVAACRDCNSEKNTRTIQEWKKAKLKSQSLQ